MGTAARGFILMLLKHAVMFPTMGSDDYILPGQTFPDDPNACFWFYGQNENRIFRCCNGTQKSDPADITGSCKDCPDGYYGNNCTHNCTCQHDGICNKANGFCNCTNNYFGNDCQYPCNCLNGGTCLPDGSCLCSDRFYGELCQNISPCPVDRKYNEQKTECICQDGYYGSSCSPHNCSGYNMSEPLSGHCSCNPDGGYSNMLCSSCNCSDNGRCNPLTGHCTCNPGYYGEHCDKRCSCYNGAACSEVDSDCKCAYGWNGPNCTVCDVERDAQSEQLFCGDKCFHCYNGDICKVGNADCKCTPGWKGNRCDHECDKGHYGYNCSRQCECRHGLCDHVDGSCQCDEGWLGHHCEHRCPEHCSTCTDKECLSCQPGWTGVHCNRMCEDGFYGDGCRQTCQKCNCTRSCNYTDGSCMDVVSCDEHNCTCANGLRCFENSVSCECLDSWSGPLCDIETTIATEFGYSVTNASMSYYTVGILRNSGVHGSSKDENRTALIIGTACLVAVTLIISGTILIIIRMKRKPEGIQHERPGNGQPAIAIQLSRQSTSDNSNVENNCEVGYKVVLSTERAHSTKLISTNGKNACSMSETPSHDTDIDHGSWSQTTAEERNSEHSLNGDQSKRLIPHEKSKSSNTEAGRKSAFEGPYSIVPLDDLYDSDSESDTANRAYNRLDKLRYKKENRRYELSHQDYERINRNSDTDDNDYELLQPSYTFDNRKMP